MSETLALTNGQLAELAFGLTSLDGLRTKPDEFKPYRFDDENETIWLIAENSSLLADSLKVYERAKKLLATQHGVVEGMKLTPENAEKVSAFMAALNALEEKSVEVSGLKKISRARLKVGNGDKKNLIPASVLAKLFPLLEE